MTKTKKTNILTCIFSVLLVGCLAITALLAPSPTVKADSARLGFNADGTLDVETISKWQEVEPEYNLDDKIILGGKILKIKMMVPDSPYYVNDFFDEGILVSFWELSGNPFSAVSPIFGLSVDVETGEIYLPIFPGFESNVERAIKAAYKNGYLYLFFTDEPFIIDDGTIKTDTFGNLTAMGVLVADELTSFVYLEPTENEDSTAEKDPEKDKTELGDIAKDSADKLAGWFSENTGFAISGGAIIAFVIAAIVWGKISKK